MHHQYRTTLLGSAINKFNKEFQHTLKELNRCKRFLQGVINKSDESKRIQFSHENQQDFLQLFLTLAIKVNSKKKYPEMALACKKFLIPDKCKKILAYFKRSEHN